MNTHNKNNMHSMTFIPVPELTHLFSEGKIKLREVCPAHVKSLKHYILNNLEQQQVFLSPLIAHVDEGNVHEWKKENLSMIDGSHRIKAIVQLNEILKLKSQGEDLYQKREREALLNILEDSAIPIQLYSGLPLKNQNQLYLDINALEQQISSIKKSLSGKKKKGQTDRSNPWTISLARQEPGA
ncbi:hypothetical protein M3182_04505 [Mesobacillus maritimus]|uniref:DNA sulfur modification protein DndB n=1 Tax=Mesobacillus maritimus TaxID=1643336 RepID=UPI00203F7DF2|nr:DNA sulfur modification protein DndB [Mesobacillus maritimus]MCM3585007.1 hypothetical protein [Mesobacillus maritimus]